MEKIYKVVEKFCFIFLGISFLIFCCLMSLSSSDLIETIFAGYTISIVVVALVYFIVYFLYKSEKNNIQKNLNS